MGIYTYTLPETNSSHLKMVGWNTIVSFWDGLFSGFFVSFRECIYTLGKIHLASLSVLVLY